MRLALNQRLFRAFVAVARSRTATFFAPQPRSLDDVALFAPPRGVLKRVPVPTVHGFPSSYRWTFCLCGVPFDSHGSPLEDVLEAALACPQIWVDGPQISRKFVKTLPKFREIKL